MMISIKVEDGNAHIVADGYSRDVLAELSAGVFNMLCEISRNKDEFDKIKNMFIIAMQSSNYEDFDRARF